MTDNRVDELAQRLAYRRERLDLAQKLGRPAHIARCARRVEALEMKLAAAKRQS